MFKKTFITLTLFAFSCSGCSSQKGKVVGEPVFDIPEASFSGQAFTLPETLTGTCILNNARAPISNIRNGALVIKTRQTVQELSMTIFCLKDSSAVEQSGISINSFIRGNVLEIDGNQVGKIGQGGMTALITADTGIVYEIRILVTDVMKIQVTGAISGDGFFEIKGTSIPIR